MKVTRVYAGADGESHFEEIEVDIVEVAGRFRRRSLSLVVNRAIELNSPSNQSGWFSLLLSIYQSSPRGSNIAPDIDDTEITAYCACVRLPTQRLA